MTGKRARNVRGTWKLRTFEALSPALWTPQPCPLDPSALTSGPPDPSCRTPTPSPARTRTSSASCTSPRTTSPCRARPRRKGSRSWRRCSSHQCCGKMGGEDKGRKQGLASHHATMLCRARSRPRGSRSWQQCSSHQCCGERGGEKMGRKRGLAKAMGLKELEACSQLVLR